MSASRATFTALPAEIHSIIFSFIEADFQQGRRTKRKSDPLPDEIKRLAFINQQWRRLVIGRKFRFQHLFQIEDVRGLATLTAGNPVVATSLRDLTVFVAHSDLPELWGQILKWAEEGASFQSLVIKPSYIKTSRTQLTGTGGGKYALYEFAGSDHVEAASPLPIPIEKLELNTSITDPDEDSDQVLQLGHQSMNTLLSRLRTTTSLRFGICSVSRSRGFLRTTYQAACGYMESVLKFQDESMTNLTTLQLRYEIFMSRQPYNTSTRSFYLDEKIDSRGDNLSNLLRQLSKRLKTVLIRYDRVTSEIFEPKDGTLADGETEDWPYLHTFHLTFSDIDAYGYRRSELRVTGNQDEEEEEEEEGFMDDDQQYQDTPKNDNDGFDWLNPDVVDDKINYKDDRAKRTATAGVRSFYLTAAKAVANKMRTVQSFKVSMNLSFDSQVYMEYANQPKLVIIGHQVLEPNYLPENEDEDGDNELVRIFKEGLGGNVRIKYILPKSL
ncbi:hypothetical protein TWF718_007681 [Orbilia javanica]|uniref:Uncharacterized protein n=1 Tax=Orbilia javanica TaxID=47235 RepID=A0AAN8RIM6_9PEZI